MLPALTPDTQTSLFALNRPAGEAGDADGRRAGAEPFRAVLARLQDQRTGGDPGDSSGPAPDPDAAEEAETGPAPDRAEAEATGDAVAGEASPDAPPPAGRTSGFEEFLALPEAAVVAGAGVSAQGAMPVPAPRSPQAMVQDRFALTRFAGSDTALREGPVPGFGAVGESGRLDPASRASAATGASPGDDPLEGALPRQTGVLTAPASEGPLNKEKAAIPAAGALPVTAAVPAGTARASGVESLADTAPTAPRAGDNQPLRSADAGAGQATTLIGTGLDRPSTAPHSLTRPGAGSAELASGPPATQPAHAPAARPEALTTAGPALLADAGGARSLVPPTGPEPSASEGARRRVAGIAAPMGSPDSRYLAARLLTGPRPSTAQGVSSAGPEAPGAAASPGPALASATSLLPGAPQIAPPPGAGPQSAAVAQPPALQLVAGPATPVPAAPFRGKGPEWFAAITVAKAGQHSGKDAVPPAAALPTSHGPTPVQAPVLAPVLGPVLAPAADASRDSGAVAALRTVAGAKPLADPGPLDGGGGDPLLRAALHADSPFEARTTAPGNAQTAHRIAAQIGAALHNAEPAGGGGFELALDPAELGPVRLRLVGLDQASLLIVHAERPETLELMRRHIGALEQDLRALGHDNLTLRFAGGDQGRQGPGGEPGQSRAPGPDPATGTAALPETTATAPKPARLMARDHLDLRL